MTSALVGPIAFRRWLEPGEITVNVFDVHTGVRLPVADPKDGDAETNPGGSGRLRGVWRRAPNGQLRCVWV